MLSTPGELHARTTVSAALFVYAHGCATQRAAQLAPRAPRWRCIVATSTPISAFATRLYLPAACSTPPILPWCDITANCGRQRGGVRVEQMVCGGLRLVRTKVLCILTTCHRPIRRDRRTRDGAGWQDGRRHFLPPYSPHLLLLFSFSLPHSMPLPHSLQARIPAAWQTTLLAH